MLGKRQRSVIGKLSELLVSGSRAAFFDLPATSPRGPLDPKALQSSRSPKNYDLVGVGLGIVAALEISNGGDVCRPRISRTGPTRSRDCFNDDSENYTYVTCYGPNCQSFTKVYYDGGEFCCGGLAESRPSREEERAAFPVLDFLSSCHSCSKKLHGEDIYMYRYIITQLFKPNFNPNRKIR